MKNQVRFLMLIVLFLSLSGFAIHKFYVSIYQINYNQKKQTLEITSRIFIDDLNDAMKLEFNKKTTISDNGLSNDDLELLKKHNSTIEITEVDNFVNIQKV